MENLLSPDPGLVFWTLIVFGIVLFLLKKYAWKPILTALDEREANIEQALEQAQKARAEMAMLKADNEKILAEAKEERSKILKEAREIHDRIVGEATGKAKDEAQRIVENAMKEIENKKMAALTEVKNQVGQMAIDISKRILRKELAQKQVNDAYVAELVDEMKLN